MKKRLRFIAMYPNYWLRLQKNYAYDRRRFGKYSSADSALNRQIPLRSWINGDYHKIEKALALRSPRPGFGIAVVSRLVENLECYMATYGIDEVCVTAINTLKEYVVFNTKNGIEEPLLYRKIEKLAISNEYDSYNSGQGGTIEICKKNVLLHSCIDLKDFFKSRHSIRQFSDEPVPAELVNEAIEMAQKTPSVCNRQSWRVYAFSEPFLLEKVLACQMGNQGFGDQIKCVLVVTSNTETFFSIGERNQCWIDGGMFSMSVVYALHSLGLGSICLNWSVEKEVDVNLHNVASIPDSEAIIMLIGVGFLPDSFRVAQSHRGPIDQTIVWNSENKDIA
jgi:nitroreductase